MRNYTTQVIEKMNFTKVLSLYPFPGKYPTRVLVAERLLKIGMAEPEQAMPLREFKGYKVIYLGKPNLITLKKIAPVVQRNLVVYEFDKKNLIYSQLYSLNGSQIKTSPSFSFYHAYTQLDNYRCWPWFLAPWRTLRVGEYTTYNHFQDKKADEGLRTALQAQLNSAKIAPSFRKNVNL